jgi:hypothetical protein
VLAAHVFLTRFRAGEGSLRSVRTLTPPRLRDRRAPDDLSCLRDIGALAGLAGFMFLSRFGNITVVAGLGLELKSVGAVVVGGVNIFGGSGSVLGRPDRRGVDRPDRHLACPLGGGQRILARGCAWPADPLRVAADTAADAPNR